jgi:hypothetical protein
VQGPVFWEEIWILWSGFRNISLKNWYNQRNVDSFLGCWRKQTTYNGNIMIRPFPRNFGHGCWLETSWSRCFRIRRYFFPWATYVPMHQTLWTPKLLCLEVYCSRKVEKGKGNATESTLLLHGMSRKATTAIRGCEFK